jgi:hypothetical protein
MEYSDTEVKLIWAMWALRSGQREEAFKILDELIEKHTPEELLHAHKETKTKD